MKILLFGSRLWSDLVAKCHPDKRVHTPTILQMEAVECGATALGIILAYHGRIVPLAELRQACAVSRDGSKASNLLKAAKSYGLIAKGFKKGLDLLPDLSPPYIAFWNFNHFVVVEGFGRDRVYLNDPATGPRQVSLAEFDAAYTGVVLVMEPGAEFCKGGEKPNLAASLIWRLRHSVTALAYCLAAGFLLALVGVAVPVFSQLFVDQVLIRRQQGWLQPLLWGMLLAAVLRGILTFLQLRALRRLKVKLAISLSSQFLWHTLRLPISFYAQRFAGEIGNRVYLNDRVADVLSGKLATTVIDVAMVLFYGVVMTQYDRVLTAIGVSTSVINILVLQRVARYRADANLRLVQDQGKVAGAAIAGLQSIETLKASGLESDFFARWAGYYTKAANARQELSLVNQGLSILPTLLTTLSMVLVLIVGGWRVIGGHLSIGMLVAFQSLAQSFQAPIDRLVAFGGTLQELEGDLTRLDDVLANFPDPWFASPAPDRVPEKSAIPIFPKLRGQVSFRQITFGYSRATPPLITDFNLEIQPGQRVALVGGSGSGKSTIARLVSGLYEPWSGEIAFDGQPRSLIAPEILTNSIAMVEQELFFFAGTIRDNLTLWDNTVPESNLLRACQDAAIHEVILAIPGGYNAQLLEGATNLSGGQRQRLEIARSLVNNPAILVMDEATSALDPETEQIIDCHLRQRGCTCIIVAHRLSTIRDCDEIIVLEQGRVVQRGTHEQLWQMGGLYAELIRSEE